MNKVNKTNPPDFSQPKRPGKLSLQINEIHLWAVRPQDYLDTDKQNNDELLKRYKLILTPDEIIKQERYKFAKDQHDALITRVFVRDLLSQYADIKPQDWRFEKGEKDKPEIVDAPIPLRFNLSHTKNLIICAVMLNDDIGCDVENITRSNDVLGIADRYFSPSEVKELFALPLEQQRSRFFDYWTLKESYIKAWGLGLAIPLKDFSFDLSKENISLSFSKHRVDQPDIWRSWLLYPSDEHRIALSVRGRTDNQETDFRLRYFESRPLLGFDEVSYLKS